MKSSNYHFLWQIIFSQNVWMREFHIPYHMLFQCDVNSLPSRDRIFVSLPFHRHTFVTASANKMERKCHCMISKLVIKDNMNSMWSLSRDVCPWNPVIMLRESPGYMERSHLTASTKNQSCEQVILASNLQVFLLRSQASTNIRLPPLCRSHEK